MAFLTGRSSSLVGLYHHHRPILSITRQSNLNTTTANRWWLFSTTGTESTPSELAGKNAYDLLGVSETSSFAEIKASFRRLAKETHPDLVKSLDHSSDSHRFIQILAAYEKLFTIANYGVRELNSSCNKVRLEVRMNSVCIFLHNESDSEKCGEN